MARNDIRRAQPGGRRPQKPASSGLRKWFRRLIIWGVALALFGAIAVGIAVAVAAQSLPSFSQMKSSQAGQMIVVRARDGSELVTLGPSYGRWIAYPQIPQVMKDAIVSTEDKRFRDHIGVDPIGVIRSFWVRIHEGHWAQGGSTITQQLARNLFLSSSKTFSRKLREMILAMALESKFSKDQILELYLNKVYFGGGAYGIDAASRKFFNHAGTQLSLPEAAIIAGLVKAPSHYSPTSDAEAGKERAKIVLDLMRENGKITAEQEASADLNAIHLAPETGQNSVRYFTDWALPQLDVLLPDNSEPIEVWTTLDPAMQKAATDAIQRDVPKGAQGALLSLDRDGAVLAMVGGTDYVTSNYNRAVNAMRQPGSSWKLFVYLAALEAGYRPEDSVMDEPVTINGWSPHNDDREYAGKIDVRSAFAYSKNTVAASLGNEVGFSTVAGMARRFGISTPITTYPSMVLGTNEVRVIDMTRAFAEVAAGGRGLEPYGITKVTSMSGEVLYQHQAAPSPVLVPDYVTAEMTDLLQTAVQIGTGRAAQIGRPVAGKTGTTSSNKDGWFLGFSSGITTGVWMGRDDAKPVAGLYGGTAPARAFSDYMRVAVAKRPVEQFQTEAKLPDFMLEPTDEASYANPADYYYVDEQGNLVDPNAAGQQGPQQPAPGNDNAPVEGPQPAPGQAPNPPAAANADFLDRAIGRAEPGTRTPQRPGVRRVIPPTAAPAVGGAGQRRASVPQQ